MSTGKLGHCYEMGFPAHFLFSQAELGRTAARPGDLGSHSRCTPEGPPALGALASMFAVCQPLAFGVVAGKKKTIPPIVKVFFVILIGSLSF